MEGAVVQSSRLRPRTKAGFLRSCKSLSKSNGFNKTNRNRTRSSSFRQGSSSNHIRFNNNVIAKKNSVVSDGTKLFFGGKLRGCNGASFLGTWGNLSRDVFNAICLRIGNSNKLATMGESFHITEEYLQPIFNEMQLYPSDSQVAKMLQYARQCSRTNGVAKNYLTYGEFCLFVSEMKNQTNKHQRIPKPIHHNRCSNNCEVFLGGSCNPTSWRADTAIPELQKNGITFYNPQVSTWSPELVAQEHDAKQAASVLLFVIDSQTRSTVGMIEVAYLVASGRCVVVVAQPYQKGQTIMGEVISDREYLDLVEGQTSLLYLVKSRGVKIHNNLPSALQCTAQIVRNVSNSGISAEEQLRNKIRKLRETYDSYGGQMKLSNVVEAYEKLTNSSLDIERFGMLSDYDEIKNSSISFDRFCTLMAEFSTEGCDNCNGRLNCFYPAFTLLRIRRLLNAIIKPFSSALAWASQPFWQLNNNSCDLSMRIDCLNEEEVKREQCQEEYDVYLGGSTATESKWRDVAVALLKSRGMSYYNPALRERDEGSESINGNGSSNTEILRFKQVMDCSKVLLFVVTNDSRSLTTMILASHYIGQGKKVVLAVHSLPQDGVIIANEMLTKNAIKDYNRARVYLTDLAKRKEVPVFENITDAVVTAINKVKR